MFVGGVPAIINRISFTGELGYEIYVAPHYQLKLYEELMEAGKEFNIKPFGGRALMSMRLEKNWGAWTLDYRPDFTAKETEIQDVLNVIATFKMNKIDNITLGISKTDLKEGLGEEKKEKKVDLPLLRKL